MKQMAAHPALKDSTNKSIFVMLAATMTANALSFIFQFYMGRALGKDGYGVLGSLSSILYIALVFAGTVQTAIAKSVTIYKSDGLFGKVASVSAKSIAAMLMWGAGAVFLLWIFSPQIAQFLNIENAGGSAGMQILLLGITMISVLVVSAIYGVLQGMGMFREFGANMVITNGAKLVAAALFVTALSMGVGGALASYAFGHVLGCALGVLVLVPILRQNTHENVHEVFDYSWAIVIGTMCMALIPNIDVILVRHYIPAEAGEYSAVSLLGKVLVWAPTAITTVMFPKMIEAYVAKKKCWHFLSMALLYTAGISGAGAAVYLLFPQLMGLFFGASFQAGGRILGIFGIAMCFFALSNVLLSYGISTKNNFSVYLLIAATAAEILLISQKNQSAIGVAWIVLWVNVVLFAALFVSSAIHTKLIENR
ncbi:MAG: oligosaccharide flippase family protein [Candidatus Thermoplasmatota archaeon]|nr:oligosaccharide flippase family protein [Candidatus Thermoplasmatota archaeon]